MVLGGFNALYVAWGVGSALDVFNSIEGRIYLLRRNTIGKLGLSCSAILVRGVRRIHLTPGETTDNPRRLAGVSAQVWLEVRGNAPERTLIASLGSVAGNVSSFDAQYLAVRLSRLLRVPLCIDSDGLTGRS
jgi:hypothetical protein